MSVKRVVWIVIALMLVCGVGSFGLIQLIPYGRDHRNPPVVQEPKWDSPQTRALAQRACFDCHSNETIWPWYSNIAPVSWLVARDVYEGRQKLNFSEWGTARRNEGERENEIGETVSEGEMPPGIYLIMHGDAVLSNTERQALSNGLRKTFGTMGSGSR